MNSGRNGLSATTRGSAAAGPKRCRVGEGGDEESRMWPRAGDGGGDEGDRSASQW